MSQLFNSFWRAVLYCIHPRIIALSMVPFFTMGVLAYTLGHFYWQETVVAIRSTLDSHEMVTALVRWLDESGVGGMDLVLASVVLLVLLVPVVGVFTLLLVTLFMTPTMVTLVATRRFPKLERKKGGSWLGGLLWSVGSTVLAALALMASAPFWLVPPLILILPPLIWGWLAFRVMSYDALADHATEQERREIFKEHQIPLLAIGVLSGYLGATPSLLWASGALFVALMPILVPLALWMYTLVFAFSSLWFAHYTLAALEQLRKKKSAPAPPPKPAPAPGFNVNIPKFLVHLEPVPVAPPAAPSAAPAAPAAPATPASAPAAAAAPAPAPAPGG